MLTTLRIKNLALVPDLTLDLHPGFNVITGETGAGKSIIIGALNLILGQRADRGAIRGGCEQCSVEAVFEVGRLPFPVARFLEQNGLEACEENQLVVKRVFSAAGANRQFINGSPTTLSVLSELGESLVDIHGPHDHQSLLHNARQLEILDAFGRLEAGREAFAAQVRRRQELLERKTGLIVDAQASARQIDLLRYQAQEIEAARLQPGEDETLEQDYQRAHNASRLLDLGQQAVAILSEADGSLLSQAGALGRLLMELRRQDPGSGALFDSHEQTVSAWRELNHQLATYVERIDLDPARLQELEARLNQVQSLKRKYGSTLEAVIAFGVDTREKLRQLEHREEEAARLEADLQTLEAQLWRMGQALSAQRRKAVPALSKAVSRQLADLGFKQSRFEIQLETPAAKREGMAFSAQGLDTIEFLFAPNPGEPVRPLRAIASSGEMARVMLALKTVLAAEDQIPVLVFDEVDANVGGETAPVVGEKMRQIGRQRQVLCVTHLAPVAASASSHLVVTKQTQAGRTITTLQPVAGEERVLELARMLGGQSQAARTHAEALLRSGADRS
jgi:DNA repair protein RecN (Recombination protein N)